MKVVAILAAVLLVAILATAAFATNTEYAQDLEGSYSYEMDEYAYDDEVVYDLYDEEGAALALQATTVYVVKSGDSLSGIAAKFGTTVAKIMAANPSITNANLIYVGQRINIPDGSAPTPTPTPTPAPSGATQYSPVINTDYKQCDNRWRNSRLGSSTICAIGCLVTSITNVMATRGITINGALITPPAFISKTSYTPGGAFYHGSVSNICSKCSYIGEYNNSNQFNSIKNWFSKGYAVVASIRSWGHYLTVWKADSNGVFVRDPAGRDTYITYGNLSGYKVYNIQK